jgi:hypothetical protein
VATANGEFAGLVLVSSAQWPAVLKQAAVLGDAGVPDLVQRVLESGTPVTALEVTSGWLEIRSFADYELACRLVAT